MSSAGEASPRSPWLTYAVLLGAVLASIGLVRPGAEDEIPVDAVEPRPELVEVEGLSFERGGGLPAFRAARALPAEPSGPLVLGGAIAGLRLERVEIRLAAGAEGGALTLSAERGALVEGGLRLEQVRATLDGVMVLASGEATVAADRIRFPGLVTLRPGRDDQAVDRQLELSLAELSVRVGVR